MGHVLTSSKNTYNHSFGYLCDLQGIALVYMLADALLPIITSHKPSQIIKNPITDHLPTGCSKIGTSYHSDQIVDIQKLVKDEPVVIVIGAMAHGKVLYGQLARLSTWLWFNFVCCVFRLKWTMLKGKCLSVAIHCQVLWPVLKYAVLLNKHGAFSDSMSSCSIQTPAQTITVALFNIYTYLLLWTSFLCECVCIVLFSSVFAIMSACPILLLFFFFLIFKPNIAVFVLDYPRHARD